MSHVTDSLRQAAADAPAAVATACLDRRRTWGQVADRVARLAAGFRGLGLEAGDRLAVWALNSDRYVELLYAAPWAGGVIVPLNTRLAPAEIRQQLEDADVRILVADDMAVPMLPEALGDLPVRPVYAGEGPTPAGMVGYETLAATEPMKDVGRGGDDLYGIFYTGGTTGRSKGVMLSHANVVANMEHVRDLVVSLEQPDDPPPTYLHVAPMFHLADLGSTFAITVRAGAHAVIPRFVPAEVGPAVVRFGATQMMLVPTMINMLLQAPEFRADDLRGLRFLTYGASPMPPALMKRLITLFPHLRFIQGYGMTELSPVATFLRPEYHVLEGPKAGKLASAGQVVGRVELRVVDDRDRPVPTGTVGEVAVRGPNVMQGYWKQPEATSRAIRDGWMHTGDAGYLDDDGFLFIVDRVKDMVITGGENVYCTEVEGALYTHPAVAACAVFGVPHDEWGEAVHAEVVLRAEQPATAEELIQHCRGRIAHYKCPRTVSFRTEPLPLSGAGKVLKTELRAPYWKGRTRAVN